MKIFYIYGHNIKNFRKKELDMMDIPIAIYMFIISLIGLILLSIFNKKLKSSTVTISEYIIGIISLLGIIMLILSDAR